MRLWKRRPPAGAQDLAERFHRLGLFDRMDPAEAERANEAVARQGIDALWRIDLRRSIFAGDAEDLAEGGVGVFLEELRPYLSERGVGLGNVEDVLSEDASSYAVRVGDEVHTVYDASIATTDIGSGARLWGLSWVRGFQIVNGLLEHAGSRERAYTMPEWDVWFLTPEQFAAVRSAIEEPGQRPYIPVDEPPWYGAEH